MSRRKSKPIYTLNESELVQQWNRQMKFLKKDMELFDEGDLDYAVKIATTLRILFHDTPASTSLAKSIEIKEELLFWSSGRSYSPVNLLTTWSLLAMTLSQEGAKYIPIGESLNSEEYPIYLSFEDWWNEIIFADNEHLFTRKDVICFLANKDGGAHVDPELDDLAFITKMNSLGWADSLGNPPKNNPLYCSIRQIATEVIKGIELFQIYKRYQIVPPRKSKVEIRKIGKLNTKYFYAFISKCNGEIIDHPKVAGEIISKRQWTLERYKDNNSNIIEIVVIK